MTIEFDSSNWDEMINLMDDYQQYDDRMFGQNDEGENTNICVGKDQIVVEVYQTNGWVRQDWYWRDGRVEQVFEGRWK